MVSSGLRKVLVVGVLVCQTANGFVVLSSTATSERCFAAYPTLSPNAVRTGWKNSLRGANCTFLSGLTMGLVINADSSLRIIPSEGTWLRAKESNDNLCGGFRDSSSSVEVSCFFGPPPGGRNGKWWRRDNLNNDEVLDSLCCLSFLRVLTSFCLATGMLERVSTGKWRQILQCRAARQSRTVTPTPHRRPFVPDDLDAHRPQRAHLCDTTNVGHGASGGGRHVRACHPCRGVAPSLHRPLPAHRCRPPRR